MKKQLKVKEIQKILDKKYPNPPVPLNHKDPYTLLIAVLLSARCTDKKVNEVTPELFKLANKFVFIVIACYPAKKTLPDGRNVHLSLKTAIEWKQIIKNIKEKYSEISPYVICSTQRKQFVAVS